MALFKKYHSDWHDYFTYHAPPTSGGGVKTEGVPIGINPNGRAADLDLSGVALRPRRFNNPSGNASNDDMWIEGFGPPPLDTMEELVPFNSGYWSAVLLTPRHLAVCKHFIEASGTTPFSENDAWPENARSFNKVVFMNKDGEYFVRTVSLVDGRTSLPSGGFSYSAATFGGDSVVLLLDEPIPEDSGIKIWNKSYVLDNDQMHATLTILDSQGRIYQREHHGFGPTSMSTQIPMSYHRSGRGLLGAWIGDRDGSPDVHEEGWAGEEDQPINYKGIGIHGDGIDLHSGDSGSPVFVESKTKGTLIVQQAGGGVGAGPFSPFPLSSMESFKNYLQTFNDENGTDYTFDYEIITDAKKEFLIPPPIQPLVYPTQEGMRSRQLICEVTATGLNGEVVTKRSDPFLSQDIVEPPILPSNGLAIEFKPSIGSSTFTEISRVNGADSSPLKSIILPIDITIANTRMDPLTPYISGNVTLEDQSGRTIVIDIPRDGYTPWRFSPTTTDEFVIPSEFDSGTVNVTASVTTKNGTATFVDTFEVVDVAQIEVNEVSFVDPVDATDTGVVKFTLVGPSAGGIVRVFIRSNQEDSGQGVPVSISVPDGLIGAAGDYEIPISYNETAGLGIDCNLHANDFLFLEASLSTTDGRSFTIGDPFSGGIDDLPAIQVLRSGASEEEPICPIQT